MRLSSSLISQPSTMYCLCLNCWNFKKCTNLSTTRAATTTVKSPKIKMLVPYNNQQQYKKLWRFVACHLGWTVSVTTITFVRKIVYFGGWRISELQNTDLLPTLCANPYKNLIVGLPVLLCRPTRLIVFLWIFLTLTNNFRSINQSRTYLAQIIKF